MEEEIKACEQRFIDKCEKVIEHASESHKSKSWLTAGKTIHKLCDLYENLKISSDTIEKYRKLSLGFINIKQKLAKTN